MILARNRVYAHLFPIGPVQQPVGSRLHKKACPDPSVRSRFNSSLPTRSLFQRALTAIRPRLWSGNVPINAHLNKTMALSFYRRAVLLSCHPSSRSLIRGLATASCIDRELILCRITTILLVYLCACMYWSWWWTVFGTATTSKWGTQVCPSRDGP